MILVPTGWFLSPFNILDRETKLLQEGCRWSDVYQIFKSIIPAIGTVDYINSQELRPGMRKACDLNKHHYKTDRIVDKGFGIFSCLNLVTYSDSHVPGQPKLPGYWIASRRSRSGHLPRTESWTSGVDGRGVWNRACWEKEVQAREQ